MRTILTLRFTLGSRDGFGVRLILGVAVAATLSLGLVSCGGDDLADEAGAGDRLTVVASFYPLAEAAGRVGGDGVEVTNLTPAGVEPHDLELTPDALQAIATADLVLYVGGGFQPAIEEAVVQAGGAAIDVLEGLGVLDGDPHVWLDPIRYADVVRHVADALAEISATDAAGFTTRSDTFVADLEVLDDAFADGLASCESRLLVVSHEAFGYLAESYGLEQEAITGVSPEAEPDPRRLAELRDLVEVEGVTTIFTEELVSPAVAETLAAEAGVATAVLNPLEGLTAEQEEAGADYLSVMRDNLEELRDGLRCD